VQVSDVKIDEQDLSFHVDKVGVPVLVKVSYFPNWSAHGAEGPYRIGPNMMVVVPTANDVSMTFDRSTSDLFFYALTAFGIVLLIAGRIWGDRVLAALDARGLGGRPSLVEATPPRWDDGSSVPSDVSWASPDATPPRGWYAHPPPDEHGPADGEDAVRDVDDDPATDAGAGDSSRGGPLA
jgi:hypothetical protein